MAKEHRIQSTIFRLIFAVSGLAFSGGPAFANSCGEVKVDCSTRKISIGGKTSNIYCGAPGPKCKGDGKTRNGKGRVGGRHSAKVVKDGVRIEGIPGMGDSGGGRVFHMSKGPTCGCIGLTDRGALDQLKGCKGAPLTITGADGGGGGSREPAAASSSGRSKKRRSARVSR